MKQKYTEQKCIKKLLTKWIFKYIKNEQLEEAEWKIGSHKRRNKTAARFEKVLKFVWPLVMLIWFDQFKKVLTKIMWIVYNIDYIISFSLIPYFNCLGRNLPCKMEIDICWMKKSYCYLMKQLLAADSEIITSNFR